MRLFLGGVSFGMMIVKRNLGVMWLCAFEGCRVKLVKHVKASIYTIHSPLRLTTYLRVMSFLTLSLYCVRYSDKIRIISVLRS